jgi:methionyl aminopeptidase
VKANRFGNFQRIIPASLAPVNVRNITRQPVPDTILRPPYADEGISSTWAPELVLQSEEGIKGMRKAGQLAKQVLQLGSTLCQPGVTTNEINSLVHQHIVDNGAYPSPLNYMGFPKSVCTSINNIIAHGIPDDRPLQDGDIINIDITVSHNNDRIFFIKKGWFD